MLRAHLVDVSQRGYAVSNEELRHRVMGVAAPVIVAGELIAAITLVSALDDASLRRLGKDVRVAADAARARALERGRG